MSQENGAQERSEAPTEKRLRKAKEEGQIARSKDLNTAVVLLLGVGGLVWFGHAFYSFFVTLMEVSFSFDSNLLTDSKAMPSAFSTALKSMLETTLPYFLLSFVAMWVIGSMPGGFIFSTKLIAPKGSKLNPIKGLGRMLGGQAWMELLKSIIKIGLLGASLTLFLSQLWDRLLHLPHLPIKQAVFEGTSILALCLFLTVALLLLIAAIDVPYQKFSNEKKVKMTKQEVKEERKSTDGSPELKNRIRQIQYQMANRKITERAPEADVIITNPTHYAVAIKYSQEKARAPYVLAKGVDEMALRIRSIGKQNNLEVLEIPQLARAVYYSTRVDQEVPSGLYTAIAYVLTYVTQLRAYRAGRGNKPAPIPTLDIPKSLLDRAKNRGK